MGSARRYVLILAGSLLVPGLAFAQDFAAKGFKIAAPTPRESTPEDAAAGKALYADYCLQCHGVEGDGQGVMADLLDPRPRDFRRAIYKIRRTPQGELPTDQDLFRIVSKGMIGTSMPAWQGLLSEEQIWQLVAFLKGFAEEDFVDYPPEQEFLLDGKIELTPESVARGEEIYVKAECAKCHGVTGRGDGPSAATLEDEWEFRIFPANLTQPWTLRGGSSVEDLYRTITTGVNGTPMPSFSDSWEAEDLWQLANYLHSIGRTPVWGEISRAKKIDSIPTDPFDAAWDQAPPIDIRLAGQIIQEPRLFNPSVLSLTVQAVFDDKELALLLTWDDRIENNGDGEPNDRVSVLFSAKELEEGKKPYFLMGDRRRPVDAWQWSPAGGTETFIARGMDAVTPRASPVTGKGKYRDGQYRVILSRSLMATQDDEVAFAPGQMIPIAFNVWDGENAEVGKQRAISRWYYLLLEPEIPWTTYVWPLVVVVLSGGGEVVGLRRLRRRWARQQSAEASASEVSLS